MASRIEIIKMVLVGLFILWSIRMSWVFGAFIDSFFMALLAVLIYTTDHEKQ